MSNKETISSVVFELFEKLSEEESAIDVLSLSTSDGFPVQSFIRSHQDFEADTMAAAASTLFSVSNAVAQQILAKQFKSTLIEANEGNVCFVAVSIADKDFVLAMSANGSMNIASLRICINRLASEIKKALI